METFREQLRRYRTRRGISMLALAERADLSDALLSRLQSGHRAPTTRSVGQLVAALTLTRDEADGFYAAARLVPPDLTSETFATLLAAHRTAA